MRTLYSNGFIAIATQSERSDDGYTYEIQIYKLNLNSAEEFTTPTFIISECYIQEGEVQDFMAVLLQEAIWKSE